jgi:hypothetical protein
MINIKLSCSLRCSNYALSYIYVCACLNTFDLCNTQQEARAKLLKLTNKPKKRRFFQKYKYRVENSFCSILGSKIKAIKNRLFLVDTVVPAFFQHSHSICDSLSFRLSFHLPSDLRSISVLILNR